MRRSIDNDMVELVRKAAEIALGVDHHLLDEARALFQQTAQQVRFSRARIALHGQTRAAIPLCRWARLARPHSCQFQFAPACRRRRRVTLLQKEHHEVFPTMPAGAKDERIPPANQNMRQLITSTIGFRWDVRYQARRDRPFQTSHLESEFVEYAIGVPRHRAALQQWA